MTGYFDKVYEEIYKGYLIEIYCFGSFAPGGVGSTHYNPIIDGYHLPGSFDTCYYNPFQPSADKNSQPTPQHSSALVAAKAYCDQQIEMLEQRRNEQLSLTLSYREANILRRTIRATNSSDSSVIRDLQQRIGALLQEPPATKPTNFQKLLSAVLTKIRRFIRIEAR